MVTQAEEFKKRIDAGDENALKQAVDASEDYYVIEQAQVFAAAVSMKSDTYPFKMEFNDQSYLLLRKVDGEIVSTECGVT
jgi:hypothetical protein